MDNLSRKSRKPEQKTGEEEKIREIKEMQKQIDRRQETEREAERLICQGKVKEAADLLDQMQ